MSWWEDFKQSFKSKPLDPVDVGKTTVTATYDGGSVERKFEGYAHWLPAFGNPLYLVTSKGLAREWIASKAPIEIREGVFYPRSRFILYRTKTEPLMQVPKRV